MKTNLIGEPKMIFDGRKCSLTNLKGIVSEIIVTDEMIELRKMSGNTNGAFKRFPIYSYKVTGEYMKQQGHKFDNLGRYVSSFGV